MGARVMWAPSPSCHFDDSTPLLSASRMCAREGGGAHAEERPAAARHPRPARRFATTPLFPLLPAVRPRNSLPPPSLAWAPVLAPPPFSSPSILPPPSRHPLCLCASFAQPLLFSAQQPLHPAASRRWARGECQPPGPHPATFLCLAPRASPHPARAFLIPPPASSCFLTRVARTTHMQQAAGPFAKPRRLFLFGATVSPPPSSRPSPPTRARSLGGRWRACLTLLPFTPFQKQTAKNPDNNNTTTPILGTHHHPSSSTLCCATPPPLSFSLTTPTHRSHASPPPPFAPFPPPPAAALQHYDGSRPLSPIMPFTGPRLGRRRLSGRRRGLCTRSLYRRAQHSTHSPLRGRPFGGVFLFSPCFLAPSAAFSLHVCLSCLGSARVWLPTLTSPFGRIMFFCFS